MKPAAPPAIPEAKPTKPIVPEAPISDIPTDAATINLSPAQAESLGFADASADEEYTLQNVKVKVVGITPGEDGKSGVDLEIISADPPTGQETPEEEAGETPEEEEAEPTEPTRKPKQRVVSPKEIFGED